MVHPHAIQLLMTACATGDRDACGRVSIHLASALARELKEVDQLGAFFDTTTRIRRLPRKLIAEPMGPRRGRYRSATFPLAWMEWNGKYPIRCQVRKGDMAFRRNCDTLAGRRIFTRPRGVRRRRASFVTAHDGFRPRIWELRQKHNEANGEDNRMEPTNTRELRGEGPTDDAAIVRAARAAERNLWCALNSRKAPR